MFWKRYPKKKPRSPGWYQVTINYSTDRRFVGNDWFELYHGYVMDLYYYPDKDVWIDNRIKQMVDCYIKDGELKEDLKGRYNRTNSVIAWRKMPKMYMMKGRLYVKK